MTDELFKTFWHYFQNISVMLVETISSETMELVGQGDGHFQLFFHTERKRFNFKCKWMSLAMFKTEFNCKSIFSLFFSINSWPSKIPNGPLKMMEGANDGPQKFWPGYNTDVVYNKVVSCSWSLEYCLCHVRDIVWVVRWFFTGSSLLPYSPHRHGMSWIILKDRNVFCPNKW